MSAPRMIEPQPHADPAPRLHADPETPLDAGPAPWLPAATETRLHADMIVERGTFRLDVRVEVAGGEVLAVLGCSGAGKSTLLRAVAGLLPVAQGHIALNGELWDDAGTGRFLTAPQRRVGVVFQDYRLFPHLSVLDNVAFAGRVQGLRRSAARAAAQPWLERLGLGALARRRPSALSGGQAQRVALARALAADPQVLLLDEPFAALDTRTHAETREGIVEHLAAFGGPSILVTHDPRDAELLADRVIVLDGGQLDGGGPDDDRLDGGGPGST